MENINALRDNFRFYGMSDSLPACNIDGRGAFSADSTQLFHLYRLLPTNVWLTRQWGWGYMHSRRNQQTWKRIPKLCICSLQFPTLPGLSRQCLPVPIECKRSNMSKYREFSSGFSYLKRYHDQEYFLFLAGKEVLDESPSCTDQYQSDE